MKPLNIAKIPGILCSLTSMCSFGFHLFVDVSEGDHPLSAGNPLVGNLQQNRIGQKNNNQSRL